MAFSEGPQGPSSHNKVSPVNLNLPFLSHTEEFLSIPDHRSNLRVFFQCSTVFEKISSLCMATCKLHKQRLNLGVLGQGRFCLGSRKWLAENLIWWSLSEVITSPRWKCSLKGRFWENRGLQWTCEEFGVEIWIDLTEALGRNWSSAIVPYGNGQNYKGLTNSGHFLVTAWIQVWSIHQNILKFHCKHFWIKLTLCSCRTTKKQKVKSRVWHLHCRESTHSVSSPFLQPDRSDETCGLFFRR